MADETKRSRPADTGTGKYDTYVVQSNDTISNYAENLWNRNPELQQQFPRGRNGKIPLWGPRGVVMWLVNFNNNLPENERPKGWQKITARNGELCDGTPERSPHLGRVGQVFVYPEVANEILDPQKPCPPAPPPPPAEEAEVPVIASPPPPPAAAEPAPEVTAAPRYQAIVNPGGTVIDGHRYDRVDAFVGEPPRDVAANSRGPSDRQRKDLRPGIQEGRIVDVSNRSGEIDTLSSVAETLQLPVIGGTPGGLVTLTRGKPGHEIEFKRRQHYVTDPETGEIIGVNPKNRRKLESGFNLDRDADGDIRTTQAMLAQISLNRRNNPDYSGVFGVLGVREAFTAHNLNRPLTNTGEGLQYTASYLGAERWYEKTDTEFTRSPNAATAEKMLQVNLQLAMHPLIWSVDSYGAPVQKAQALREEMQRVVDALPNSDDKTRLIDTYITPYAAVMQDPVKLDAAIKGNGGRENWVNPMRDWADERLKDKRVVRDFSDVPIPDNVREQLRNNPEQSREIIKDFRQAEAKRFLYLSADGIWNDSIRTPTAQEAQLGTGLLNDVEGQKETNLAPARVELLQHLHDNPQARAAWMDHMLSTQGGLQNVSDLLNLSSNTGTGNYALLNYPNGRAARDDARAIASGLAGEDQGERLMHRKGGFLSSLGNGMVRFATAGFESDAVGIERRNLDRGQFGFQEATAARWRSTNGEQRQQVDAALVKLLDGAIAAANTNTPVGNIAATGLVLTMDPDRAANMGATQTFDALASTLQKNHRRTIDNQMVANLDNAGDRYVSAAVDRATSAGVIAGEQIVTVSEEQARAAAKNGGIVALTEEQKAKLGNIPPGTPITYTTVSTEAAEEARNASNAARAMVLTVSPDEAKVSQNQLNALNLTRMAEASPAAFASVVTNAIVAADKAGKTELAASLRARVDDMRHSQGGAGDALASLITRQAKALKAGDGSPESLAAASQQAFDDFFTGRYGRNRTIAAASLAGNLGSSPSVSAAVMASAQSSLAGLPPEAQQRLLAIGEIRDPAEHAQALKAFGEEFSDQINADKAKDGVSLVELAKWVLLVYSLTNNPQNPGDPELPRDRPPIEPGYDCKSGCELPPPPLTPSPPPPPPPPKGV